MPAGPVSYRAPHGVHPTRMLIRNVLLSRIQKGEVTLQFRRWRRPTVKTGGTLRTAIGVLAIDAVEVVALSAITPGEAQAAGYETLAALRAQLAEGDGLVYRVRLRYAGADPRAKLRQQASIDPGERDALQQKLARLDARSRHGNWTWQTLRAIDKHPGLHSQDLADLLGFERMWLKAQVRKLKELGLTESLEVGYRLAPRGGALLREG